MSERSSRLPYVGAVVLLGLLVVFAWVGRGRYQPVGAGAPAPDFQAVGPDGSPVSLSDYRGKVVLVNVWATWCAPCRYEMPSMERLYKELGSDDFEILAVSVDAASGQRDRGGNPGGDLKSFADEYALTFPILHDPEGAIERLYRTTGVPESFLVGRDGLIYKRVAGPTEWDAPQHQELIRRLLAASS